MYKSLSLAMLSQPGDLSEAAQLAAKGFDGLDASVAELAEYEAANGKGAARNLFDAHGVRPGVASGLLPGVTGVDEAEWQAALEALPEMAALAAAAGYTRTSIVMLPFHNTPYEECFAMHVQRLREACGVLIKAGMRLGVEYVSQETRRAGNPHTFIYTIKDTMDLFDAVDAPNLGLLLDSFHWYCADESLGDIQALGVDRIVVVHLADAPDRPLPM
jgi:sugar phosphate isomerase/epimerase